MGKHPGFPEVRIVHHDQDSQWLRGSIALQDPKKVPDAQRFCFVSCKALGNLRAVRCSGIGGDEATAIIQVAKNTLPRIARSFDFPCGVTYDKIKR